MADTPHRHTSGDPLEDEVDRIIADWHRERPDLDTSPLQVMSRLSRLARHLDRARSTAFATHGLEVWEFDVLAALRRAGAPHQLTPGQLVTATMVSSGTMTNRVDRLEERGLVSRAPDPHDGRGVLVELTPAGATVVDIAFESLLAHEQLILKATDGPTQTLMAHSLRHLLAGFE